MKATCIAVAENGRISLLIDKGESGYEEFNKVFSASTRNDSFHFEVMVSYGDVADQNGNERCGLRIDKP